MWIGLELDDRINLNCRS